MPLLQFMEQSGKKDFSGRKSGASTFSQLTLPEARLQKKVLPDSLWLFIDVSYCSMAEDATECGPSWMCSGNVKIYADVLAEICMMFNSRHKCSMTSTGHLEKSGGHRDQVTSGCERTYGEDAEDQLSSLAPNRVVQDTLIQTNGGGSLYKRLRSNSVPLNHVVKCLVTKHNS